MNDSKKITLAAIDIGTNSVRMLIADADPRLGVFNTIAREREMVRLGSGYTDMKHLSSEAMARAMVVLKRYKALADSADAQIRAVATSAVRESLNQEEFLKIAKSETGIDIEVISGFEEARLIYLAVMQTLGVYKQKILVIDVGGGSTEFIVGQRNKIFYANSLKLGAVRLTRMFFEGRKKTSGQISNARKYIKGVLSPLKRSIKKENVYSAIGTSGTILCMANVIRAARKPGPCVNLNNFSFSCGELFSAAKRIVNSKGPTSVKKIPGMDPGRSDIITAGALITDGIFRELGVKRMVVCESSLKEGLIVDAMEKKCGAGPAPRFDNLKHRSIIQLAELFNYEKMHSHQVVRLALSIFDQTRALHRLASVEREFLEAAAILHDIGFFVSHAMHHKHSYYIIRNSELIGFTENEKEMIANIARYHRKSLPKYKHEDFCRLFVPNQAIVRKLSALLRIADGLDRTHTSAVKDVICKISSGQVLFLIRPSDGKPVEMELWGAERKNDLFEKVFRLKAVFKKEETQR